MHAVTERPVHHLHLQAERMKRPDLKHLLDTLPTRPGVYQYFDDEGEVIYVGKAKSLRSRVRSYFHDSAAYDPKTTRLVEKIKHIEWIVTESELEALLLEMNLIKRHRPRYNVLLKDDKRYPYLKVTWADDFPKLTSTRNVRQDGARYYGPYTSALAMRETVHTLRKIFPYLDCDRVITGEDERACLYHDMGLCLAPCIGAVDNATYRAMIEQLCRFLGGDTAAVIERLTSEMEAHAERMEYEQAARARDRLEAVERVIERQRIIAPGLADRDVVALAREDGSAVAQVFFVRNGKLVGREYFQLEGTEDETNSEVLAEFVKQFYDETSQVPGEIVLPEHVAESEIIARWLRDKRGTSVKLAVPKRGQKKALMDVAVENANETLRALKAAHAVESKEEHAERAMADLQEALGLPRLPRRIECYDISTLQGESTVGAMVVFSDAAPNRPDYRHFKIKTVAGQDDYAAMGEMLSRRFTRLAAHRAAGGGPSLDGPPGAFERTPGLVLVDGGKGQLAVARRVLAELGLDDLPLASLAKREELLFQPGEPVPVRLPRDSQALFLVQRARDEAHRFAITYNRKLRRQKGLRSSLEEVPGVGPKRRKALLLHFGSVARIRAASLDDIAAAPGMTRRVAEQIKAYL